MTEETKAVPSSPSTIVPLSITQLIAMGGAPGPLTAVSALHFCFRKSPKKSSFASVVSRELLVPNYHRGPILVQTVLENQKSNYTAKQ